MIVIKVQVKQKFNTQGELIARFKDIRLWGILIYRKIIAY